MFEHRLCRALVESLWLRGCTGGRCENAPRRGSRPLNGLRPGYGRERGPSPAFARSYQSDGQEKNDRYVPTSHEDKRADNDRRLHVKS